MNHVAALFKFTVNCLSGA